MKNEIFSIESFWRAANYLVVGMLYLKDNVLLHKPLRKINFKNQIYGHWGTCPAINAIYAHVSDLSRRKNIDIDLVIGTGHSAPALLACLFLDGTLEKYDSKFTRTEDGIKNLFNSFAVSGGFSSEINMDYPGTLFVGGELGESLAFSQGCVFHNPNKFIVCVIGDGEFETSISHAAWQGFNFMRKNRDGKLLPIINLNGNKMGSESILSTKTHYEIQNFFNFYHLKPIFANSEHERIFEALSECFLLLNSDDIHWPVLVLETPKGWTAPSYLGKIKFENSYNSHKPILNHPFSDDKELKEIKNWLLSYRIDELFPNGEPNINVLSCLPKTNKKIGDNVIERIVRPFSVDLGDRTFQNNSDAITALLSKVLMSSDGYMVFSPDELKSNGLAKIKEICKNGEIIEILNEQLCFSWAHGFSVSGRCPFFITYEAFAPLVDSLVDQYVKALDYYGNNNTLIHPSINIIITSLGWKNVSTHHNPSFVDRLIPNNNNRINILFPVSPLNTIDCIVESINSNNALNVIICDKRKLELLYKCPLVKNNGVVVLKDVSLCNKYILILTIGDIVAEEALKALQLINENEARLVKIIAIENINILNYRSFILNYELNEMINSSFHCFWLYNGYIHALASMLWKLNLSQNHNTVMGYMGKSFYMSGEERMRENNINSIKIAEIIKKMIKKGETND